MADVFAEIDEELRDEKLKEFWREYGNFIILMAVCAVLTTAAMSGYRYWTEQNNIKNTTALISALEGNDVEALVVYATNADANHAMVAKLTAASLLSEQGHQDRAVALYSDIAQNDKVAQIYRDLATLLSVNAQIDTGDVAVLDSMLSEFYQEKHSWRYSALELKALLHARQQEYKKSVEALKIISLSNDAPYALKTRAMTLGRLYTALSAVTPENDIAKGDK